MPSSAAILIVDDRPDKLLALEAVLEDLGPQIVRAYSGREALRHVLEREFAVILLDVNMPGMDGFETAQLIRQRKSSEHIPIIFITAFGDEMHAARGYSLGAVDYILAPVLPEVLRTKVSVFVELFAKTEQVKRQAETMRRRATQLQKLAAASVAINSALSTEKMLQTVTETARDTIGSNQAITLFLLRPGSGQRPGKTIAASSFSDKYHEWRGRELHLDVISTTLVAQSRTATRLTESELRDHPDWDIVRHVDLPPVCGGMLAAPLTARDGANLGVLYLCDRFEGSDFSNDDEAILVQLAQMASIALENTLYAEEREANRIKDEFLATLSHELRTPLNAILGWTQLLRMDGAQDELDHGLEVIERNARSQTKLIEDLLDVSRITTGKMRLSVKPVALGPVVRAAADAVRPAVEAKQIRLEPDAEFHRSADALISGDADRLQQVFWNLFANAAKFTPAGGSITYSLRRVDDELISLRVTDTGHGIDPKFLPYVFDRFRQADSSSTRSHGGLGIGLTIVRHIVELHGGTVHAESTGAGRGSTFVVTLPLAAAPPVTGSADVSAPDAHVPADASARSAATVDAVSANGDEASTDVTGVRVLVVDDEPDAREVLKEILTRCGAEVITAASAAEAMVCIQAVPPPDVLVSDIAMPDEDGYALMRQVRALSPEQGGQIPAIALTAYARDEDRQRALAVGFQQHLTKPVGPEELAAAVAARVAERRPPADRNGDATPMLKLHVG